VFSEYFDDIAPGEMNGGVQCQDVEHLTYHSCSVDICTCTEVFEHVPDDMRGFSEVFRVLKPGGMFLFTVPLLSTNSTIERTRRREDGEIEHLLPPEYHGDNIRGRGRVLTYRNYGTDIIVRLKQAGFTDTDIRLPAEPIPWGYARPVVVGRKGGWFEQPSAGRC
jgi:SAM-dependent methyltransferase